MNIAPFEIHIEDSRKFGLVAFLIDRDDFLQDIANYRKTLKIKTIPWQYPSFQSVKANNIVSSYNTGLFTFHESYLLLKNTTNEESWDKSAVFNTLNKGQKFATTLAKKYKKDPLYEDIIFKIIFNNSVEEADFKFTKLYMIHPKYPEKFTQPITFIRITPESTLDEVKKEFDSAKEHFMYMSEINYDKKLSTTEKIRHIFPDTISNIKRDRIWYWKKKTGLSYQQIWEQTNKKYRPSNRDGIIKAIKQYRKRLNVEV